MTDRPGDDSLLESDASVRCFRAAASCRASRRWAGPPALGVPGGPAYAATTMTWMGWQGYETPIKSGTFLKDNDIDFQPTFIASNEEIISKLQAGGIGKTDLVSMYFGYLQLMHDAGLIETIDQAKIAAFDRLIPEFTGNRGDPRRRQAPGRAMELGLAAADVRSIGGFGGARKLDGHLQGRIQGQGRDGRRPAHLSARSGERWSPAGPTARSSPSEELAKMIDLMIKLKKEHARAFFPSYGDMARRVRAQRGGGVVPRLGGGRSMGEGQGQGDPLHDSQGRYRPVHGLPGDSEGRAASRSSPTR